MPLADASYRASGLVQWRKAVVEVWMLELVSLAGGAVPCVFLIAAHRLARSPLRSSEASSFTGLCSWALWRCRSSRAVGWAMSRFGIILGTTAVWGMLPGAATVMMLMAEAFGTGWIQFWH